MTTALPTPQMRPDGYGHARMPRGATVPEPQHIDRVPYGRFRNVYLYITEACQLRCEHCYMGERLDRALKTPLSQIVSTLTTWRRMGGSKLTILGGEPTLHSNYVDSIRFARRLGYEHVITTTNAQASALKKFRQLEPDDFAYVQVSLDGGSSASHDAIRGPGTFDSALETTRELAGRGFDVRIICTVNKANEGDALKLLEIGDELGVSLVKFHVFSTIGTGHGNPELAMTPPEWVEFCDVLGRVAPMYDTRVWYQPTYARRDQMERYAAEGYQGCIGRTLDRISIFPDGRCYVCSYLFDTDLYFARMDQGQVVLNHDDNEFDLFTKPLAHSSCSGCKVSACLGGCPAEEIVMGTSSCAEYEDIVPVCRLWKSSAKLEVAGEEKGPMDMETVVEPLRALDGTDDWDDIDAVEAGTRKVLDVLTTDRSVIRRVLTDLPREPKLLALAEHYDILDKIVLWDDPTGFRVRLHMFLPGYFDRPHNHRWSYASTILRGQYRHYLFGNVELHEDVLPRDLEAVMVRQEQVGNAYALHHSMVHAVVAEPYTVSLVVRGPAVKDRFLVMDRKTGESWWQYGAAQESPEDAAKKRMSVEHFRELRGQLDEWGIL